jgi:mannose-6-phosphate isomerase-like protein (cupin superfamily)
MIDKSSGEHYKWGADCDAWHLVKSDAMSVIQEYMPPHTTEVRHYHARSRQFFFVLSGRATFEVNGEKQILESQQGLEIPPGIPHQVFNDSEVALSFLAVSCPPSHDDRINA